mgnify:FL=1
MKKTLAALAVLGAFAGSAMAADVTVYGIVDVGVKYVHSDPDEQGKDATDSFTMAAGNQSGNRFGLKGVEDLGNGVSVGFVLENGFAIDDGTLGQSNRLFGREANLFVRSAFGELSFGRVGALDSANGSYGLLGYLSPFGASWGGAVEFSTFYVGGARMDNTVTYKSPNFAGFNAYAQYSFGMNTKDKFDPKHTSNDATDDVAPVEGKSGDTRYAALGATYVAGPFNLAASAALYNWSSTEYTDNPDNGYTLTAGGYYNCGFAKTYLSAQYFDNMYKASSNATDKVGFASVGLDNESFKGWAAQAGFDMPLAGGTAMLAFGYADTESANSSDHENNDNEFTRWGTSVGYTYSLSKRTNVYGVAGYYQDKKTVNKAENKPETTTVYVGMRHSF